MRIQHNIMAMNAYRNYTTNTSAMQKNLERLSSGFKINRAGDDAAGLAISEKMRAQITGLEVAQKNAKDGISLVQTAEGALTEVHDMLNRMVELASQSANGTYSNDTDRVQLQKELDQLRAEIDRIADSANFNGIQLLDGNMDAGGDTVYTKGLFQFNDSTLHPTGIGNNVELPTVGDIRGTSTILHTEGTMGGDKNMFSVDFENLQIKAGGTIDIKIGSNLTITVANLDKNNPVGADDIVSAIAAGGSKTVGVTFTVDGTEVDPTPTDGKITLGDGVEFTMKADGSRLTFTQTSEDGKIDMPQTVEITSVSYVWDDGDGGQASKSFDVVVTGGLSGDLSGAIDLDSLNNATITLKGVGLNGEENVTLKLVNGATTKDNELDISGITATDKTDLLSKIQTKLEEMITALKDKAPTGSEDTFVGVGSLTLTADDSGVAATATATKTTYGAKKGEPEPAGEYQPTGTPVPGTQVDVTKNTDSENLTGDYSQTQIQLNTDAGIGAKSVSFTINDQTYTVKVAHTSYSPTSGEVEGFNVIKLDLASSINVSDFFDALKEALKKQITAKEATVNAAAISAQQEYTAVNLDSLKFTGKNGGFTLDYTTSTMSWQEKEVEASANESFSGDWNVGTTDIETKFEGSQDRLASTVFDLSKIAKDGEISEGTTITIGRDTYVFTYDKNKLGKDGYVVMNKGEDIKDTAVKLTEAAKKNSTYTVGHDKEGRITLLEKEDQTNFDLTTMEGIEKSLGFKIATTRATDTSKGLTLQIGDTAESYNQLKVNIKDCHVKALSLDQISIASQADAADAVDAINDAINYVSDVRGTLGATQNRLDHTINNLSVMTENIQDAESTIRDTDIAEEMMAYTKNNILIQAAQAMLAQANQVPQGVLQLLQ